MYSVYKMLYMYIVIYFIFACNVTNILYLHNKVFCMVIKSR